MVRHYEFRIMWRKASAGYFKIIDEKFPGWKEENMKNVRPI